jgi:hypothetical protein
VPLYGPVSHVLAADSPELAQRWIDKLNKAGLVQQVGRSWPMAWNRPVSTLETIKWKTRFQAFAFHKWVNLSRYTAAWLHYTESSVRRVVGLYKLNPVDR